MNGIFSVLQKYMKFINFETKDIHSQEARELHLAGKSVVVDGIHIFSSHLQLKNKLPAILKEKGLIK